MDILLSPAYLKGVIQIPPSKSEAHRVLICAALANEKLKIKCINPADDIMVTAKCLTKMGAKIVYNNNTFIITPWHKTNNLPKLNCKESASSLRFLIPLAAALGINAFFYGKKTLSKRPLAELLKQINGCNITSFNIPFYLTGKLKPGTFVLPGNISSQYISGLLLALPSLEKESKIVLSSNLESAGYVDITLKVLSSFGINIIQKDNQWIIPGNQKYISPKKYILEADWSAAAFWLIAAAIGADISLKGLNLNSLQPDKNIINILKNIGATVAYNNNILKISPNHLKPFDFDASTNPDLVPILALALSLANGNSKIYNAARLRTKESDRLHSITQLINDMGGKIIENDDALLITGVPFLKGGIKIPPLNDHRLIMTAAIAAIFSKNPTTISSVNPVSKSYPDFFNDLKTLGGNINVF